MNEAEKALEVIYALECELELLKDEMHLHYDYLNTEIAFWKFKAGNK